MSEPYLVPTAPLTSVEAVREAGRGTGIALAAEAEPAELRSLMAASGLRRRDHGAEAIGEAWTELVASGPDDGPRFVVVNATDAEPGSFVDRFAIRSDPFGVIEGLVLAAAAIGARETFVCLPGDDRVGYEIFTDAIARAEVAGWLEDVSIKCVRSPNSYLLHDPRAVLEVVEGRAPVPMRRSPVVDGLFAVAERPRGSVGPPPDVANPTAVETPETLLNVAAIARRGAEWFRGRGTAVSPGNILLTVTGDVPHHAVAEVEIGRTVSEVISEVGGSAVSDAKAVLNGVSSPVLTRSRLAAPLSWEGMSAVGASLGRAAFRVLDEGTDMIGIAHEIAAYLYIESCGWCPPCKFGGGEVTAHLAQMMCGHAGARDVEVMGGRIVGLAESSRCELPSRHRDAVTSILRAFPSETMDALGGGSAGEPQPLRRLDEIVDGRARWNDVPLRTRADGVVEEQPVRLTCW